MTRVLIPDSTKAFILHVLPTRRLRITTFGNAILIFAGFVDHFNESLGLLKFSNQQGLIILLVLFIGNLCIAIFEHSRDESLRSVRISLKFERSRFQVRTS